MAALDEDADKTMTDMEHPPEIDLEDEDDAQIAEDYMMQQQENANTRSSGGIRSSEHRSAELSYERVHEASPLMSDENIDPDNNISSSSVSGPIKSSNRALSTILEESNFSGNSLVYRERVRVASSNIKPFEHLDISSFLSSLKSGSSRRMNSTLPYSSIGMSSTVAREERTPIASRQSQRAQPTSDVNTAIALSDTTNTMGSRRRLNFSQAESASIVKRSSDEDSPDPSATATTSASLQVERVGTDDSIQLDQTVLAFGFVAVASSRCLEVIISNTAAADTESVWIEPSIVHADKRKTFKLMDTYSFDVPAQKTRKLRILFTPTDVHVFNANLILTVMPQKTTVYKVDLFGYGGAAEIMLNRCCPNGMEPIAIGTDRLGVCTVNRKTSELKLMLHNKSARDAFAHLQFVRMRDGRLLDADSGFVSITPQRLILPKGQSKFVRISFLDPDGLAAMCASVGGLTRATSQTSVRSAQTTRTLCNEPLARLHVYWGEERQRQRLKMFLGNKTHRFHDIDFVKPLFVGEAADTLRQKRVGDYDIRPFAQSVRVYQVQFVDNYVRPPTATHESRPTSVSSSYHEQSTLASEMATFCEPLAQSSMRIPSSQLDFHLDANYNMLSSNDADETIRPRHKLRGGRLV